MGFIFWSYFLVRSDLHTSCQTFLVTVHTVTISDIDNGITGEPEIKCGADKVEMQFRTRKPFKGKIFVKGHYVDQQCKVDYTSINGISELNATITVRHGTCDMQRQRMISPHGMQLSSVVIVSFHPVFITGVDKAYNIKCMYREVEKTVSSDMEVSALTTAILTYTFPMPQCSYTIRKDTIDGEIMKYARVGDQVVHRWQCDTDVYGILVHSCYVEDGQGDRVFIVDEKGCHQDRYILGDPTYVEQLNMAYRESHVFKFADRLIVRFQCQIRLCVKFDNGCIGITPPLCSSPIDPNAALILSNGTVLRPNTTTALRRQSLSNGTQLFRDALAQNRFKRSDQEDRLFEPIDGDFMSQDIYVLETTESPDNDSKARLESWKRFIQNEEDQQNKPSVCLSLPIFLSLISIIVFIIIIASLTLFVICIQRLQQNRLDHKKIGICLDKSRDDLCYQQSALKENLQ